MKFSLTKHFTGIFSAVALVSSNDRAIVFANLTHICILWQKHESHPSEF